MYRFFYSYKTAGDILFLLIDPESPVTKCEPHGDVIALWNEDRLVGVNFMHIGKTMKIHAAGMIAIPEKSMLDCVNHLLANAGLPTLEMPNSSGYRVLEVKGIEEHPLDEKASIVTLTDGEKTYSTVSRDLTLKAGEKVVAITDRTIAYDGSVFHRHIAKNIAIDVELCNAEELRIGEAKGIFRAEEPLGSDFYLGE